MGLKNYIQRGIDFLRGGSSTFPEGISSSKAVVEEPGIYELLVKINDLREELKGGYIDKDESFIIEKSAKVKRNEIDSMLKRFPFRLVFGDFLEYGDYLELVSLKGGDLYFETKKKERPLCEKYGLTSISERPWFEEIRLRKGETDVLYTNHWGPLEVYLKFPEVAELMKDVLSLSPPPGIK